LIKKSGQTVFNNIKDKAKVSVVKLTLL